MNTANNTIPFNNPFDTVPATSITYVPSYSTPQLKVPLTGGRTFEVTSGLPETKEDIEIIMAYLQLVVSSKTKK